MAVCWLRKKTALVTNQTFPWLHGVSTPQRATVWKRGQTFCFPGETHSIQAQGLRAELAGCQGSLKQQQSGWCLGKKGPSLEEEGQRGERVEFWGIGRSLAGFWLQATAIVSASQLKHGNLSVCTQKELLLLCLFQGDNQTPAGWSETTSRDHPHFFQKPIKRCLIPKELRDFPKRCCRKQRLFWDW